MYKTVDMTYQQCYTSGKQSESVYELRRIGGDGGDPILHIHIEEVEVNMPRMHSGPDSWVPGGTPLDPAWNWLGTSVSIHPK